jgi:hypothetical protein
MARTPFKLRSGNTTPFKQMGSSPLRDDTKKKLSWGEAYEKRDMDLYGDLNLKEFVTEGKRQIADKYTTVPKTKMKGSLSTQTDTSVSPEEETTTTTTTTTPKPTFEEKVTARQQKYNPENKSIHERRLERKLDQLKWQKGKPGYKQRKRMLERQIATQASKRSPVERSGGWWAKQVKGHGGPS